MTVRVFVLGGYGIFGTRLCRLLAAYPQLTLLVGGRSLSSAQALCKTLPGPAACEPLRVNRDTLQAADLLQLQVDVVIDASGPFQAYGDRPYGVVQACLVAGVNYLDFADGADFVDGIAAFDSQARQRGVFVLSGVSSFPVLTAAVVRLLSTDMHTVQSIRGGIAPSPFAVVGKNVIRAIAGYAGQAVQLTRGGQQTTGYGLTESCSYTIAPPGYMPLRQTHFSLVEVPDLMVLPKLWPGVREVWMGAGPVPEILHRMLKGLAWLVRWRVLPTLRPLSPLFFYAIKLLRWGEHRGGMFVEVQGLTMDGQPLHRSWHLLAEGEDGPYIPCMALQAVVQKVLAGRAPKSGARPASGDVEVADYLDLFVSRTIYAGVREHDVPDQPTRLFKSLLGSAFDPLPATLKQVHQEGDQLALVGQATVRRGHGVLVRGICSVFGFPQAGEGVPVSVHIWRDGARERWQRRFGSQTFSSVLSAGSGKAEWLLVEQFGPFRFRLALVVDQGVLRWVVRGASLWGVSLPGFLLPTGASHEYESEGRFHFHVEIRLPFVGLVVNYRGWLEPTDAAPTAL
jgi:Domain of unknown function (DUF4166)/Saccharopine dehydrogenase NADP binding domain